MDRPLPAIAAVKRVMRGARRIVSITLLGAATAPRAAAQTQDLDYPFGRGSLIGIVQGAFDFGVILIVLTAAIFIGIGAYMYLAAAGNAETARAGKEYITRAIMGLVLGLIAWIILNTIHPQFTQLPNI